MPSWSARVPGHCAAIVTAKVWETVTKGPPILFEPDGNWNGEMELHTEDSLVQPNSEGQIKQVVHNPSIEAKLLADSMPVGSTQLCTDLLAFPLASAQPSDGREVDVNVVRSQVHEGQPVGERERKLSEMLNVRRHYPLMRSNNSSHAFWELRCICGGETGEKPHETSTVAGSLFSSS